jgi:hypothetical protein
MANSKNRKKIKQLELRMVIKSRHTHFDKINTRSHPSLWDVVSLDPKRNPGKKSEKSVHVSSGQSPEKSTHNPCQNGTT